MTPSARFVIATSLSNLFQKSPSALRRTGSRVFAAATLALIATGMGGIAKGQSTSTLTFTTVGNGTWTCPNGVTAVQVEAYGGGGGAGGAGANFASTGGGAGGSYVKATSVSVTAGTTYQLTVGAAGTGGTGGVAGTGTTGLTGGSSYFGNTTAGNSAGAVVLAVGGPGSVGNNVMGVSTSNRTATNGATATNSGNLPSSGAAANFAGTNGANAVTNTNNSGAGGAGAGPSGSSGGGVGGAALTSAGNGKTGTAPGGGGSGADQSSSNGNGVGGTGGAGEVVLTFVGSTPLLTATGTATPVSTPLGTASTPTTFIASGSSLSANITVTAPSGFEVSTAVGSGYSTNISLPQSGGSVAATPVYVRLASTTLVGAYSGNVSVSSTGASTVTFAIPSSTVVTSFTQGNLAVEALANQTASSTFAIIELSPSTSSQSAPANTYYVPATVTSSSLRQSDAGSTGRLSTSNDGTLVAFTGAEDTTGVADETSITLRGAASLSQGYQYALQASYTDSAGAGDQTRGATFNNSTWYMSDKNGIWLNGTTTAANTTNIRPIKSYGGTVYAMSANATAVVSTVSTDGTTLTGLPGLTTTDANAVDFYMLSSGVNGSAYDVLYVCDGATVTKYSSVSGTWTSNGSAALGVTGDGFCASGSGSGANLYVTTGATSTVLKITDAAGYNQPPSINTANNVTLYTGPSAGFLKGVAFAPLATALPDLTISAAGPSSASASFAYTVTVANSGAASASGVNAQFTLPSGLTFVSGTDNGSGGFTVSNSSGVVSITGGTLAAGATDTITVQVTGTSGSTYTVDAGTSANTAGDGFAVINTSATTSSPIAESNTSNNGDNVASTTVIAAPVITTTGTLTAVSSSYGIASAPTSFSVSGSSLSSNITVTAPSGFEVSTSSSSGYAGTLTLAEGAGTVPATTIYVRLAATDASGMYSGSVSLATGGGSTVFEAIPSSTVNPSANLTALTLTSGGLTQPFSAGVTSYTQYVNSSSTSVTLTPTAESGATVTVNGQPAGTPVVLTTGTNVLTIVVTNDGLTQTYTVTVVRAGALTPGDLVVTTYGNIETAQFHPDGLATIITLSEFAPTIAANSTPVEAFALPSATTGNNVGLTGEYGSSSEGAIQQTADGLYLTIGGYDAAQAFAYTGTGTVLAPGSTALAQSENTQVSRVAALIDVNTNANTTSVFNDIYNTNNPRCVYSADDFNLFLSGQGAGATDEGGIYYTQLGTNTTAGGAMPTGIYNVVSTRNLTEFGGNFYYSCDQNSSSKGTQTGIFEYTNTYTSPEGSNPGTRILPAANNAGTVNYSPEGFWFANATTLYVADTGDPKAGEGSTSTLSDGGIQKWVYNGSQWVLQYTLTSPNFVPSSETGTATSGETGLEAMTGTVTNGVAYLYGCSYTEADAGPNGLYGVTDTLTATSSTATLTEIEAAPGQQASGTNPDFNFKGVSFAPIGTPANPGGAATAITASGATLNGSINPEGVDTTAYFQYGTNASFGMTTATQDLGSGSSAVPFNFALSGLQPGTTYYYQLVTVSNGLTSTYTTQSFTTAAATAPPATDTPTMPPAALVLLALAFVGVSGGLLRRRGEGLAG